jgi:hypothetical protein
MGGAQAIPLALSVLAFARSSILSAGLLPSNEPVKAEYPSGTSGAADKDISRLRLGEVATLLFLPLPCRATRDGQNGVNE